MPTLKKLLSRFNKVDRESLEFLIEKIISLDWHDLDIKKLKGYQDVFRLRKGKLRIIFTKNKDIIRIIDMGHRSDNTYKL